MEHLIFHSDLGDIHYWLSKIDANRPTLVFTHGVLINHETFDPQIKYFAKDYNIITWDLPLHGLSKECTGFTLRASAEIMQGILDKEGIDQVILVGQSLGASSLKNLLTAIQTGSKPLSALIQRLTEGVIIRISV